MNPPCWHGSRRWAGQRPYTTSTQKVNTEIRRNTIILFCELSRRRVTDGNREPSSSSSANGQHDSNERGEVDTQRPYGIYYIRFGTHEGTFRDTRRGT